MFILYTVAIYTQYQKAEDDREMLACIFGIFIHTIILKMGGFW